PGTGVACGPAFDPLMASQVPFVQHPDASQAANRDAPAALLDKIRPAIVMTHSQSGAYRWPIVEARPQLVKALIQAEPSAPPVHDLELIGAPDYFRDGAVTRPWGLGAIPLKYSPAAAEASQLSFVQQDKADGP